MGAVIRPVLSVTKTESGKMVVWYDKTVNSLLRRAVLTEVKN